MYLPRKLPAPRLDSPFVVFYSKVFLKILQDGGQEYERYSTPDTRKTYKPTREDIAERNVDESCSTEPQGLPPPEPECRFHENESVLNIITQLTTSTRSFTERDKHTIETP